ncbi:hypothetical protein GWK48_03400 [Metallosphaera tengchongensis]|uniref:Uncharacterized protein n=1 Tax=Metallosphaera tengchongensis TaxID=1532350 RepID=A0A6N0NTS0_9CREN|nr:hypothetical protein [Metallosphaera tengchongensis]QKQ99564.1 hypothetical protein GWK48_03400 [Metallosphaera tengchongensis]
MNCSEEISRAYYLSWVGDKAYVDRVVSQCIKEFEERDLIKDIRKVMERINQEWLVPASLREEGVDSHRLVRSTLHEFLRRLSRSTELRDVKELDGIKYSVSDLGFTKILRGYCERCYGFEVQNWDDGFGIRYEKLIYAQITKDPISALRRLTTNF